MMSQDVVHNFTPENFYVRFGMVIFLLVFLCLVSCEEEFVVTQEKVDALNSIPNKSWTAWMNPAYEGKNFDFFRRYFHTLNSEKRKPRFRGYESRDKNELPANYDIYDAHPYCKQPLQDQGKCGGTGAISGADVLSDRFCQATKGKVKVVLSPEDILACIVGPYACNTGCIGIHDDWCGEFRYMEEKGVVSEKCLPFSSGKTGQTSNCPNKCVEGSGLEWEKDKHFAIGNTTRFYRSVEEAMQQLLDHGSFQSAIECYEDLFTYKHGVYSHQSGKLLGGVYVRVMGWGKDSVSGQPYWNVATYFGPGFGMDGYLWMKRGSDECQIEDQMMGVLPKVD